MKTKELLKVGNVVRYEQRTADSIEEATNTSDIFKTFARNYVGKECIIYSIGFEEEEQEKCFYLEFNNIKSTAGFFTSELLFVRERNIKKWDD